MTVAPEMSPDEPFRLQALRDLHLVDTPIEERFERLTRLAHRVLAVDVVAISLVEADRLHFKSIQGVSACELNRDVSFCAHAILEEDIMVVRDARRDPRFKDNPYVTGPAHIVFYAGAPIRSREGAKIGVLCAIHSSPHDFSEADRRQFMDIAALVELEAQIPSVETPLRALAQQTTPDQLRTMVDPVARVWNVEGLIRVAESDALPSWVAVLRIDDPATGRSVEDADAIVHDVAKRLLQEARETDTLGRTEAGDFVCVLSACTDESEAQRRAHELAHSAAQGVITLNASIAPVGGDLAGAIAAAARSAGRPAA